MKPRTIPAYLICFVLAASAPLSGSGCASGRSSVIAVTTPPASRAKCEAVLFVIDGAGNFQACSQHIREALRPWPVEVVTFEWSHGYGRIIADQIGYAHARGQGCRLAQVIAQVQRERPGIPVHVLGHSAGALVVTAALEQLPPEIVARAFMLAPSLSASYDMRPALMAVKDGLHVYHSRQDIAYLGIWTGILGNSDRCWGPSSGRIGFRIYEGSPEDRCLYAKLHQRPWQPADRATGNDGKHYGDYQPEFVRQQIVPLLRSARAGL